jgi:tetratricopeptide (TPR) repeat protein
MDEYEHISDYFNGLLSAAEMARFDENIQQDPAFAENVAFYLQAMQELKGQVAAEKKGRFRELYEAGRTGRMAFLPVQKIRLIVSAAAIISALVIGWWFYRSPAKNAALQMADNYIKTELQTMSVTMGNEDSLQQARRLYNEGKFSASLQQFEAILQNKPGNAEALKDAGIVSLQLQQYDKSLVYFNQLEQMPLYINPGKFYHAVTLLKRNGAGDESEAKKLLQQVVDKDLAGKETARTWLAKW